MTSSAGMDSRTRMDGLGGQPWLSQGNSVPLRLLLKGTRNFLLGASLETSPTAETAEWRDLVQITNEHKEMLQNVLCQAAGLIPGVGKHLFVFAGAWETPGSIRNNSRVVTFSIPLSFWLCSLMQHTESQQVPALSRSFGGLSLILIRFEVKQVKSF